MGALRLLSRLFAAQEGDIPSMADVGWYQQKEEDAPVNAAVVSLAGDGIAHG